MAAVRTVVVDDAVDVRRIVARQLKFSRCFDVVGEGGTGREAIELAGRLRPELLLLDASMPDVDGLEALPHVLEASPETKVVVFSGFAAQEVGDHAREQGAVAFLEKSVPVDELPARLLAIVRGEGAELPAEPADSVAEAGDEGGGVLAEHLERFRDVFDRATIGMATTTLTGTIVRSNGALWRIAGTGADADLVGRPYAELAHPDDRSAVEKAIDEVVTSRRDVSDVEHRLPTDEGVRWVTTTFAAVRDSGNRPLYLYGQVQDITSRHEAAEELRLSEERFRLLVEAVVDYAIFMLDPTGVITTWNAGAQRIKGYAADDIIGQHFRIFYTPDAQQRRHPEYELEVATREGRYEEEGWRVRKDGSRFWANVVITALFDEQRVLVGFGKVTRDMTERRLMAEEREHITEELRVANEQLRDVAEEKAQVLAVTAHELRNPVLALTGGAQLLREHWQDMDDLERAEILDTLESSAGRLRRLLDDLLTASRLEAGAVSFDMAAVPLAPVLKEAVASIASPQTAISIVCDDDLHVAADRERLGQILTNLLRNAVTHGQPPFVVSAARTDGDVTITVRDHGAGVPESMAPQLFDKFTRARNTAKRGHGLGLFIVRELARAQNGDAWYEPADPGACFVIRLSDGSDS